MTSPIATFNEFPGHVAGEPYILTREEFVAFEGLQDYYSAFLKVLQEKASGGRLPGNGHNYQPEQQAFWAAIASFEAMRRFQSDMDSCESFLHIGMIKRNSVGSGQMMWRYDSHSGTEFRVFEWRKYNDPASEYEPATLPEPMFVVAIPATRDQPGGTHYESIRWGRSYREF